MRTSAPERADIPAQMSPLSRTSTLAPARARCIARLHPTTPAPTTITRMGFEVAISFAPKRGRVPYTNANLARYSMSTYLDHNAGSPLRPEAKAAVARFMEEAGGNPASVHRGGQSARRMLEAARAQVAALIGADARQIIFTSGGTESNNFAIYGATRPPVSRRKVISSSIEHSSILAPLAELESREVNVVRMAPDREGRLRSEEIAASIDSDTALVTFALANSEVGAIQEVSAVADAASRAGAIFHLDAAQAVGRFPVNVADLRCDLMTISGHKLGAPAGIGALYVRDPSALRSILLGGPQESGLRAGTPNLLGAIAFGAAAAALATHF